MRFEWDRPKAEANHFGNLLVVVYMYREPDVVRVISAWKATKRQGELYEKDRS